LLNTIAKVAAEQPSRVRASSRRNPQRPKNTAAGFGDNALMSAVCLNYGAGWDAPSDWLNLDASPVVRFERLPVIGRLYAKNGIRFPENVQYGDVVRGLEFPDESVDLAYCSHVLEHLARSDVERAVAETFRVLRPGGLFRVVVPDLEHAARVYVLEVEQGIEDANDRFLRRVLLGREKRVHGFRGLIETLFGNSAHLWMWDAPSLTVLLRRRGFTHIRRATYGDSADTRFRSVEREERFQDAVALEACKPDC
jgi:predicted SAM-dependent methyltransferase